MWNGSLGENWDRHRPRVIVLCLVLRASCVFDSWLTTTSYPSSLEGLYQATNKLVQNCIPMCSYEVYASFGIVLSHNRETISYFYTEFETVRVRIYTRRLRRSGLKFMLRNWDGPGWRCYVECSLPICTVRYMEQYWIKFSKREFYLVLKYVKTKLLIYIYN